MDDAAADGLVDGSNVDDGGAFGCRCVAGLRGRLQLLRKRLQPRFHRLVAQHALQGFAGVFDGGFSVGHE